MSIALLGLYLANTFLEIPCTSLKEWTIVLSPDASTSEKYAAEELKRILDSYVQADIPILEAPTASKNIFVGMHESILEFISNFSTGGFNEEEFRIAITPESIVIAGGRPRGTLYGVYEFVERYLGVRFLTWDHTHIPVATVQCMLPLDDYRYTPPFSFRWSYYYENFAHPEFAARLRNNTVTHDDKLGGVTHQSLINHSYYKYLPADKYGKEHPEYFALIDGKRPLDVEGGGPEPCVTHPDVIRIITEGVLADLRANPNQKNISLSQNDNNAYCRCDRCEAINQAEGTPMGSNLYLVNAVAEAVEKEFPNVKIGTLAYWYTRNPPKNMKPRKNVQIQLCSIECSVIHPLDDPRIEKNREFCEDMEGWGRICDDIWIWDYNTNFAAYDLPFPNLRTITPNLRFFLRNNVHGVFMQANGNGNAGEMSDLRNYVMSKCLWNPHVDDWALVEEFCRLHYGGAAETILEYLSYIHDIAQQAGYAPTCFGTTEEFGITPAAAAKMYAYFQKALTEAENDTIRNRVEKASIPAYRAMLETHGQYRYSDGRIHLAFPEDYDNLFERYVELCKRHGMTRSSENELVETFHEKIRNLMAGTPGYQIENEIWRLTAVPKYNGAIVELFHKPTNRQLLSMWPQGGIRQSGGTWQEINEDDPYQGVSYDGLIENGVLVLSRPLAGGASVERRISLESSKIHVQNTIVQSMNSTGKHQMRVRPEWDVATKSSDCADISAYILDGNTWSRINCGWKGLEGPDAELLRQASGGGFAFYNHAMQFGILEQYDPSLFAYPRLWMNPDRQQLNLELVTHLVELQPGESFHYRYTVEFLTTPPKN